MDFGVIYYHSLKPPHQELFATGIGLLPSNQIKVLLTSEFSCIWVLKDKKTFKSTPTGYESGYG